MRIVLAVGSIHIVASVIFFVLADRIAESPLIFQLMPFSWIAGPSALLLYGRECIVSYFVGSALVALGVGLAGSSYRRGNVGAGRLMAGLATTWWMLFGFLAYAYWL